MKQTTSYIAHTEQYNVYWDCLVILLVQFFILWIMINAFKVKPLVEI